MRIPRARSQHSANQPRFFSSPSATDAEGLIRVGGKLEVDWLLDAYRHGIFPWPVSNQLLAWWSPDPRAIIELNEFRVSRRLQRTCRSAKFEITFDRDFAEVVRGCATSLDRNGNTWITPGIQAAYLQFHRLGVAHSVEAWCEGRLAGGVYGVAIGGMFAAESMFYRVTDASKVALVALVQRLVARGYVLLDIQQWTKNSGRFGATEIPRAHFLERLQSAVELPVTFGDA